jgi:hypothetical protein
MFANCIVQILHSTDLCMMTDLFMYTLLHVWARSGHPADAVIEQAMTLLTPKWQQLSQQQLLLTSSGINNDASNTTAVPLKLDFTTLATVLKLPCITELHYAVAVQFLVKHTGFVSYDVLADMHSTQSVLHDTQDNHTIGVSSELMSNTVWNSDTVNYSIDEYGIIATATTTATTLPCNGRLAATAVVPVQASLSLDVLNSAIMLSEKQSSAEMYSSDVIGAIVDFSGAYMQRSTGLLTQSSVFQSH